jgi:diaminohydroxyphosphoribosylaminopyrimidine deaminase/5-amino-6-(5-phosphoribosylamino)uracil reductase
MNNPAVEPSALDREMIGRCMALARKALGQTSPNPMVGALIVQNNQIVGEGFHLGAGHPHAEVLAIEQAQSQAQGATLYINLEPCNHQGKTPPCTDALIEAGIARVVIGTIDPDPRVSGSGVQRLTRAGIEVIVGVEEQACRQLNEAFIYRVTYQKPLGILKYAMTLDGKIATTSGHSAWISGEASRHCVHELRAACDAVIIGSNTVRQDNPHLTSHGVSPHNPLRVVMSRSLDLPLDAHLWETSEVPTLVFTQMGINPALQKQLSHHGVEVIELESLSPAQAMQHLYQRGASSVLWECGGRLAAQAIVEGAVQKVIAFIAPKIIGGEIAPTPVGYIGLEKMSEALLLEGVSVRNIEQDVVIEGYLKINK